MQAEQHELSHIQEELERLRQENAELRSRLACGDVPSGADPAMAAMQELARVLRGVSGTLYLADLAGRVLWGSDSFVRLTGHPADTIPGTGVEELLGIESSSLNALRRRLETGELEEQTFIHELSDGSGIEIREWGVKDAAGTVHAVFGAVRKIVPGQATGLGSHPCFLFENALEGVFRSSLDGQFRAVNPALASMLGYSSPREMMDSVTDIGNDLYVDEHDREAYLKVLGREGSCSDFETRFRSKDGDSIWVLLNTYLIPVEGTDKMLLEGTVLDISSRKRAEEKMIQAVRWAESANETKSRFLANMSHELRTPLNGAMGMLQLLMGGHLSSEQKGYVNNALCCCASLTRLVGDILDMSRIESNSLEMKHQDFDPRQVLNELLDSFSGSAAHNGKVYFCMEIDPALPAMVRGDMERFRQVLFNLAGNATKYTTEGKITISVTLLPQGEREGYRLLCVVQDSGPGIPDDRLEYMLEAFTQGDATLTRTEGGAGLGLFMVKRLVGLMGGAVSIASTPGRGSTIYLSLPFDRGASETETEPLVTAESDTICETGMCVQRVLVAEDDRVNQLAVMRFLERLDIRATCVGNGQAVLDFLAKESFDCILMDVQMPIMDGLEATRRIRSGLISGQRDIPIIALTGYALNDDVRRLRDAGMNGHLSKPVDFCSLAMALNALDHKATA